LHDPLPAISGGQLANIMFGSVFLFIGLVACAFAAVRRRDGARLFLWLGIWSILRATRLLTESPAVVALLPSWLQVHALAVGIVAIYLVLPVAVLAWLELSVGRVRVFLQAVIVMAWLIGLAGAAWFVLTGSDYG
jgi:hypothetical protein